MLATSNITAAEIEIDYVFNYSKLVLSDSVIEDNSTLLLIDILQKAGISTIHLAGFDGFSIGQSNYSRDFLNFSIPNQKIVDLNTATVKYVQELQKQLTLHFITPTIYVKQGEA